MSEDQVKKINAIIDGSPVGKSVHKFQFVTLDPVFLDLMSDQRILEVCSEWINPYFRFDHAWGVQHFPGDQYEKENIHGGPYADRGFFQYHWHNGKPTCTCLLAAYVLAPQLAGDGGLVFVPGSHKSNLGLAGGDVFKTGLGEDIQSSQLIDQPVLYPGDLVIMTEATMHGTKRWMPTDRMRRNLYYMYAYGFVNSLTNEHEQLEELRKMARNEQERLLLKPAYVSTTTGNQREARSKTILNPLKRWLR